MKTNIPSHPMRFSRAIVGTLLLIALLFTSGAPAFAASPPERMSFQGYLTDDSGAPLTAAATDTTSAEIDTFDVAFRIYSALSTGDLLWAEQQAVSVVGGSFSVLLGEGSTTATEIAELDPAPKYGNSLSALFGNADGYADFYVSITVGASSAGDPESLDFDNHSEISPRLQLVTSPFAFVAGQAVKLGEGSTDAIVYSPTESSVTISQSLIAERDTTLGTLTATEQTTLSGGDTKIQHPLYVYSSASDLSTYHLYIDENEIQSHGEKGADDHTRSLRINTDGGNVLLSSAGDQVQVKGDLVVSENTKLSGRVGIGKDADATDALTVSGSSSLGGTLDVSGTTTIGPILNVQGGDEEFVVFRETYGSTEMRFDGNEIQSLNSSDEKGTLLYLNKNRGGHVILKSDKSDVPAYLGIGTSAPDVPLEISGADGKYYHRDYTLIGSGTGNRGDRSTHQVSAYLSGFIAAEGFDAKSDARIKDVVARADGAEALRKLMDIQVTDYRMRDWITRGKEIRRGLIAQEVETVLPGAVSRSRQFLPNLYAPPKSFGLDPVAGVLSVEMTGDHGLSVGDVVRVIADGYAEERPVKHVSGPRGFSLGDWEMATEKLFIYGIEVDDFRTVDYDRVFSTGIAAIQEINRKLEVSNKELRSSLTAVTEENARLSQQLSSVMQRLLALESMVK